MHIASVERPKHFVRPLMSVNALALFAAVALAWPATSLGQEFVITSGVDTTLPSGTGLNGSDAPHGAAGENPEGDLWEWDGSDGGGENLGALWFDIPADALADVDAIANATLSITVQNEGDSASAHRITVDWLSGPNGGDAVTYNNFPGGPGITVGSNAVTDPSFSTGFLDAATNFEVDVTADVIAWASGEENYGWGFFGTGTNGVGIYSFENASNPSPMLSIVLIPDQFDLDGDGDVDVDDFNIMNGNMFAHLDGVDVGFDDGDINSDDAIDLADFRLFKDSFPAVVAQAAGIPEPTTLALLSISLAGLFFVRRRCSSCH